MIKKSTIIKHVLFFVAIVVVTSLWQAWRLEKDISKTEEIIAPQKKKPAKKKVRKLTPSRPEDFGMIVTSRFDQAKTQEEWDELLGDKIAQIKTEASEETIEKVREAINEPTKKTKEKLKNFYIVKLTAYIRSF